MPRRINLVPHGERTRTNTDFGMLALVAIAVVVIFAIGLGYYVLNGRLDTKKQELADVQQQVAQLESQVAALDEFGRLSAQREDAEALVQSAYAGRTLVADILDSISLVTPEDVWFQSVNLQHSDPVATSKGGKPVSSDAVEPGSLSIQGNTYGFEGVARMLVRLKLIPTLAEVSLVSAGEPTGQVDLNLGVRGFTINGAVVNDQPADAPLPVSQAEVTTP
jgi:Tfp pilus assembly protein PilN